MLTRRSFLRTSGAVSAIIVAPALVRCAATTPGAAAGWRGDPFGLGVAAGDLSSDGFVLWTRLAPDPLSTDPETPGGMAGGPVPVDYEIASDPELKTIVRRGTATADPAFAYSVHAEIAGLEPGRSYWYRFIARGAESRVGRAATLPAAGTKLDRLRFGFVSCANYEHGHFAAYRHLADERPDIVLFLGDYIYEYADTRRPVVRRHSDGVEATDLRTYRNRYAQYHLDADLQRLHAVAPALVTWDDHEVQNDYADQWSQDFQEPSQFLVRRAAAYRAFYEHMPLRARSRPDGAHLRLFERYTFGDLAEISLLDGRQYRSREACYGPPNKGGGHLETNHACPERLDQRRSMLGQAQETWLYEWLGRSRARWNVIGQDVMMTELRQRNDQNELAYWTDGWDGYPVNRARLLRHLHERRVRNPVVLSGDIHSYWANDLKLDFADPRSPTVATEFVGTSITSRQPFHALLQKAARDNPHVRFFEGRLRGYATAELTPRVMTTRFRAISSEADANAAVFTVKEFTVSDGRPGVQV